MNEQQRRAFYLGFRRGWLQAILLGMPVVAGLSFYLHQPWIAALAVFAFAFAVYAWVKVERRSESVARAQPDQSDAEDNTPTRHTYRLECVGYADCTAAQRSAGCAECVRVRTR